MDSLGIFQGKQKKHNVQVLTLIYDNGPLSAWEITAKLTKIGKQSLHSTLNKRLRILEKKDYVRREGRKWVLRFKGILAALLIQSEPKMWNPIWKEIFNKKAQTIEKYSELLNKDLGLDSETIHNSLKFMGLCLDDFDTWIAFADKVKTLMENGVINFDLIKEQTLLSIILMETMESEQLSSLWKELSKSKK